jgi:hypothetical protein
MRIFAVVTAVAAYPSGAPDFAQVHCSQLHVFTVLVLCCDDRTIYI